jgi:hypothetical protein
MSIYEKRLTHGRPRGRGGMSGHPEREGGEGGGGATLQHGLPNSRFRVSEFPGPLRGSAEGPQSPDSMFRSVQTPGYSSANSRFRVSEFPGPPPWVRRGPPQGGPQNPVIPRFLMGRFQDLLLCKFQIPRFRVCRFQDTPGHIPDSEFPSFRGPLLGPRQRDISQIPDSEFPSFRGPLLGPSPRDGPPIPDSEFPSFRGPLFGPRQTDMPHGTPKFQILSFRVSEDPSWVAARGTHKFPDSKFPSLIPKACQRREHRFQDTERSFYFRSCTLTHV